MCDRERERERERKIVRTAETERKQNRYKKKNKDKNTAIVEKKRAVCLRQQTFYRESKSYLILREQKYISFLFIG